MGAVDIIAVFDADSLCKVCRLIIADHGMERE